MIDEYEDIPLLCECFAKCWCECGCGAWDYEDGDICYDCELGLEVLDER